MGVACGLEEPNVASDRTWGEGDDPPHPARNPAEHPAERRRHEDETQLLRRALGADAARRVGDQAGAQAMVEVYDVDGDLLAIVPVPPHGLSIGRAPEQDIVLPSLTVSRRHCRIDLDDHGRYHLDDAGSLNDTLLNGEPVRGRAELNDGDQLTVGLHVLIVTIR